MTKKNFEGLGSLLKKTTPKIEETAPKSVKSTKVGTKADETRATFIVNEEQLEMVKALALWERMNIKELIADAFELYIDSQSAEKKKKALDFYRTKKKK